MMSSKTDSKNFKNLFLIRLFSWVMVGRTGDFVRTARANYVMVRDTKDYPDFRISIDVIMRSWCYAYWNLKTRPGKAFVWLDYILKDKPNIFDRFQIFLLKLSLGTLLRATSQRIEKRGWDRGHKVDIINDYIEYLKDLEILFRRTFVQCVSEVILEERKSFWESVSITNLRIIDYRIQSDAK